MRTASRYGRSARLITAVAAAFLALGSPVHAKRTGGQHPRGSDVLLTYHRVGGLPVSDIS
jgi:hypothetical protein